MNEVCTRNFLGYQVYATHAISPHQGGVALAFRLPENKSWHIESIQRHGPNTISFEIVTGLKRQPVVGTYLPPSNLVDLPHVQAALDRFPQQKPVLMGDLNVDVSRDDNDARTNDVADFLATNGLMDLLTQHRQRKSFRDRTTWFQHRGTQLIRSRCDYIYGRDRCLFRSVRITDPQCYSSDHCALVAVLLSAPAKCDKKCLRGRRLFPLDRKTVPQTPINILFDEVTRAAPPPPPKPPVN